jgi:hypothetical protein
MIQKVQRLAISWHISITLLLYAELKVILMIEVDGEIHECSSHGMLCLVDLDTVAETGQYFSADGLGTKSKEQNWKDRREHESLLCGNPESKCLEVKCMAPCHSCVRSFWVG